MAALYVLLKNVEICDKLIKGDYMSDENILKLIGVQRIFESARALHDVYKNIKYKSEDKELIKNNEEIYKTYCCRMCDVIEVLLSKKECFFELIEVKELLEFMDKEFVVPEEYKKIIDLKYEKTTLKYMLTCYRVMYTHPDVDHLDARENNKTMFLLFVSEKITDMIYNILEKTVHNLFEKVNKEIDIERYGELYIKQNKLLIISIDEFGKKVTAYYENIGESINKLGEYIFPVIEEISKSTEKIGKLLDDYSEIKKGN